jgi:glycine cleavage system aminomethyltransferase T
MEDHSGWLRPAYYLRTGETEDQAIDREVRMARSAVALFDSSSLGKLEVRGADAAEFLNRLYVNNVKSLQPGHLRYGLMLNDNGIIIDDGVLASTSIFGWRSGCSANGARCGYGLPSRPRNGRRSRFWDHGHATFSRS